MKLNHLISWTLATTATAAFGGLLGENYVKPEVGYLRLSDLGPETPTVDGWAGAFSANYPIMEDAGYGLDFQGNYTYGRLTGADARESSDLVNAIFRGYFEAGPFKPYVEGSTGWVWERWRVEDVSYHDDSWVYGVGVGTELPVSQTLTMTLAVNWDRVDRFDTEGFSFGASVHNWFTERLGASLGYRLAEGSAKLHTLALGVTMRF